MVLFILSQKPPFVNPFDSKSTKGRLSGAAKTRRDAKKERRRRLRDAPFSRAFSARFHFCFSPFFPQAPLIGHPPQPQPQPLSPRFFFRIRLTRMATTITASAAQIRILARFADSQLNTRQCPPFCRRRDQTCVFSASASTFSVLGRAASRSGRNSWNNMPARTRSAAINPMICAGAEMPPVNSSPN